MRIVVDLLIDLQCCYQVREKKLLMSYPKKREMTVLENALIMLIEEIYEATN